MKNLNTEFLLDIWADLKAKRLAPVAIGLLVALVAVPIFMKQGGGSAGDVPLPLPVSAASEGAEVVVDEETTTVSKLDSYKARDPFKGMNTGGKAKEETGATGAATSPLDGAEKDDGGSTGVTSGGTGGGGSTGDTDGGKGGDSDPSPGTGTGTVPNVPPGVTPPTKSKYFNFRLDIEFGKPGREKRYRSLSRLSFLQGGEVPIALYLGVNEEQDTAMFLVYPGLNHQGEGQCLPKPTNCNFLALKVGREHYFSASDREYRIELRDIKRVNVAEEKKARSVARKTAARRAARGSESGATGDDAGVEPYDWPLLVDAGG